MESPYQLWFLLFWLLMVDVVLTDFPSHSSFLGSGSKQATAFSLSLFSFVLCFEPIAVLLHFVNNIILERAGLM